MAAVTKPSPKPNPITGTAAGEALTGGTGDDTVSGLGGNDTLDGGTGNDSLLGGDGNDLLLTAGGKDTLDGGTGTDVAQLKGAMILPGGAFGYALQRVTDTSFTVKDTNQSDGDDGTLTLSGIERLRLADRVVLLAADQAPRAADDTVAASEEATAFFGAAELLNNDTDADGDPLRIISVQSGAGGTAVLVKDAAGKVTGVS